ncbi:NADH-ubiquinone oxidoreductase-F iron-sulfur binding region domain-containing protein [Intrasporangium sp. YIM S08009]|uniref:NADH-ubiquinone oxidoreductase-F iron-sulfur binding region domain-containing protein n=1 Tax=Intrasporangium zincisolvens TaxID=3080018 RepID=UPI002B05CB18|nr:NADH-ubiquinone oxidoreductase-F iron-sulfur binding region domain-containing protein [Intrasporangium sp. YIM S08009]
MTATIGGPAVVASVAGSAGWAPTPVTDLFVHEGPLLLRRLGDPVDLAHHRARCGPLPTPDLPALVTLVTDAAVRGRGGAGFPLARKLTTAAGARRRPVVVVNAAEGEPDSGKDSALLRTAPHLVLDGAAVIARALGAREIHVVTGADRTGTTRAARAACAERDDPSVRWSHHAAAPRFVSGQARAVVELLEGRDGLPVTAWQPEAVRGLRGRPTLLSNTETFAHVAVLVRDGADTYASFGTVDEPGTTLLTVSRRLPAAGFPTGGGFAFDGGLGDGPEARVVEVAHGTPFAHVLHPAELMGPVLLGGYHGTWVEGHVLAHLPVSAAELRRRGLAIGAGVVLPLGPDSCPVRATAALATFLAGESAGRCGPCINGLPALADAVRRLAEGEDTRPRLRELCGLLPRRGACAHPDGTTRLVRTLLEHLGRHVHAHLGGTCPCASGVGGVR